MITDAQHEDLKYALRLLNTGLVEFDDRVPNAEEARESLTDVWRAYNLFARVVDSRMVWPVDEDDLAG